jgi:hypothetical protein
MKTSTKWILGIVIALLVLCVIGGVGGVVATRWFGGIGWHMDGWSRQPWSDQDGVQPWRQMPMHPDQGMWMKPYNDGRSMMLGRFAPLRLAATSLLCLGMLALVVIGIVLLVRGTRKSNSPPVPTAVVSAAAPEAEPQAVAEDVSPAAAEPAPVKTCPNCGRPVEDEWSHCPYCGAPQQA